MTIDHSDPSFKEPELCKSCGEHYAYKRGQCFECFEADAYEHADQQRKERLIEKHFRGKEE